MLYIFGEEACLIYFSIAMSLVFLCWKTRYSDLDIKILLIWSLFLKKNFKYSTHLLLVLLMKLLMIRPIAVESITTQKRQSKSSNALKAFTSNSNFSLIAISFVWKFVRKGGISKFTYIYNNIIQSKKFHYLLICY